jgi:fucose permease
MNAAEGFFDAGAIVGPALLTRLLGAGLSWKWLYVIAGAMCAVLVVLALFVRYPETPRHAVSDSSSGTGAALRNPYVLAFSGGAFLYVAVEAAVYVWMPTLLARDTGRASALAAYSLSIFFLLRAAGRFLGAWVLQHARWQLVLMVFSGCILACFALTVMGDVAWAVFLLPFSGLFMSVMYPTINSKGSSCAPKRDHGAAAGVILFFTCVSAVVAPLLIGAAGDAFGDITYGYWLASGFAVLLFAASVLNWALNPTRTLLDERDRTEYVAIAPAARTSV